MLDYFEGMWRLMRAASNSEIAREQHVLFRFEQTMRFGDAEHMLLSQLTWSVGYPSHGFPENEGLPSEAAAVRSPQPWRYLTGETKSGPYCHSPPEAKQSKARTRSHSHLTSETRGPLDNLLPFS